MATVRLVCPHCTRTDRLGISPPLEAAPSKDRGSWLAEANTGPFGYDVVSGLKCHLCGGWSVGVFSVDGTNGYEYLKGGLDTAKAVEATPSVWLLRVFPPEPVVSVHDAVPEAAREFFIEAQEDLSSGRNSAGVISKCRSVLDLCLKNLKAVGAGRKARIANLLERGLLTQGLADWADRLWDDGNDAIHDLTGGIDQARQHVKFLKLFFDVAFDLPAQVRDAQGDVQGQ